MKLHPFHFTKENQRMPPVLKIIKQLFIFEYFSPLDVAECKRRMTAKYKKWLIEEKQGLRSVGADWLLI
jgi:hypothetical protein